MRGGEHGREYWCAECSWKDMETRRPDGQRQQ
jgi:hypothetical protein